MTDKEDKENSSIAANGAGVSRRCAGKLTSPASTGTDAESTASSVGAVSPSALPAAFGSGMDKVKGKRKNKGSGSAAVDNSGGINPASPGGGEASNGTDAESTASSVSAVFPPASRSVSDTSKAVDGAAGNADADADAEHSGSVPASGEGFDVADATSSSSSHGPASPALLASPVAPGSGFTEDEAGAAVDADADTDADKSETVPASPAVTSGDGSDNTDAASAATATADDLASPTLSASPAVPCSGVTKGEAGVDGNCDGGGAVGDGGNGDLADKTCTRVSCVMLPIIDISNTFLPLFARGYLPITAPEGHLRTWLKAAIEGNPTLRNTDGDIELSDVEVTVQLSMYDTYCNVCAAECCKVLEYSQFMDAWTAIENETPLSAAQLLQRKDFEGALPTVQARKKKASSLDDGVLPTYNALPLVETAQTTDEENAVRCFNSLPLSLIKLTLLGLPFPCHDPHSPRSPSR